LACSVSHGLHGNAQSKSQPSMTYGIPSLLETSKSWLNANSLSMKFRIIDRTGHDVVLVMMPIQGKLLDRENS
ncbi:hypothetical protein, partial [Vibrio parahaemolyticus]|uniref:hypothetical protein n=1 Tax=Vibrio parahaemolyticus TaxID=670 RepID=UPI0021113017